MSKSGTLIFSALMTLGLAAGAFAASTAPVMAAPMAADAPGASGTPSYAHKHSRRQHKHHRKVAP